MAKERAAHETRGRTRPKETHSTAEAPPTSETETPSNILELQRKIGNHDMQRLLATGDLVANTPAPGQVRLTPAPASKQTIQRDGDGEPPTGEWVGKIHGTWSAALRKAPKKDPDNPHDDTLADLPRGALVQVKGKERGWLLVEAEVGGKTITGYVSHELVKFAPERNLTFGDDQGLQITGEPMSARRAFVILKRAETSKAGNPSFKPDDDQASEIDSATNFLEKLGKYIVDHQTYQVTFKQDPGKKIQIQTIEDFILFVETVEHTYPSSKPADIATEVRQLWFSDGNWELLVAGEGVKTGGKEQDIETEPNPIAKMFDMKDLAPKAGGKKIATPMGTVDIGHVMAGIDARLSGAPAVFPAASQLNKHGPFELDDAELKYDTLKGAHKGDVRDFTTWAGDIGQAYAEYLVKRWVAGDASASFKQFVEDKSPQDELLGDIHGYIATEVWKSVPASASPTGGDNKISSILRDMYLVSKEGTGAEGKNYQHFVEEVSGQKGDQLREFIVQRSLAFGSPWYAKKAYDERGWWDSKGARAKTILKNNMAEFGKNHEKNEQQATEENKLGGLIKSFMELLKGEIR